jgi:hypothetical protein
MKSSAIKSLMEHSENPGLLLCNQFIWYIHKKGPNNLGGWNNLEEMLKLNTYYDLL